MSDEPQFDGEQAPHDPNQVGGSQPVGDTNPPMSYSDPPTMVADAGEIYEVNDSVVDAAADVATVPEGAFDDAAPGAAGAYDSAAGAFGDAADAAGGAFGAAGDAAGGAFDGAHDVAAAGAGDAYGAATDAATGAFGGAADGAGVQAESLFGDPNPGAPAATASAVAAAAAVAISAAPSVSPPASEPPASSSPAKKKKRKRIDLKSRLSSVRATGSIASMTASAPSNPSSDPLSFPPPPVSVPAPRLGGASLMPSISSPFAKPEEKKKQGAAQQTIKVEMGDEIIQERKKAGKKGLIYAAIAGVAALAIGFGLGTLFESGQGQKKAIAGAGGLQEDVKSAKQRMLDLSDALMKANETLGNDEYPADLVAALKAPMDFDSKKFEGRGVGGLPNDVLRELLAFTSGVEDLDKQREKLQNLLGYAKKPLDKYFKEKKDPVVNFSVIFAQSGGAYVAQLAPHKEPFGAKDTKKWPAKYKVMALRGKKAAEIEVARYIKGKIVDGETPLAIPIEEKTVANFTQRRTIQSLKKALVDTRAIIEGMDSPIPGQEIEGLLKRSDRLSEGLKKIGAAAR